VKMMTGKTCYFTQISQYYWFMGEFGKNIKKTNIKNDVCLHSEERKRYFPFFCLFIRGKDHRNNDRLTLSFFI
ncbi:hypothetical protein OLX26_08735, partial [Streptococcus agalactiae]|nr:hypothetical protein [Streptococcus agalactiae]